MNNSDLNNINWINADEKLNSEVKRTVRSSVITTWFLVLVFAVVGIICFFLKGDGIKINPIYSFAALAVLLIIGITSSYNDIRFLLGKTKYAVGTIKEFTREATRRNPFYGVKVLFDGGKTIDDVSCTIELSKKIVNNNEEVIVIIGDGRKPFIFEVKENNTAD